MADQTSRSDETVAASALTTAEDARATLSSMLDPIRRSALGQFMTPAPIAQFMASMFGPLPNEVKLLDAGAGLGALTAAFVSEACNRKAKPKVIDVTLFEVDAILADQLEITLAACATECNAVGVQFRSNVLRDDFIAYSGEPLLKQHRQFDCAILNPPYAKINTGSHTRNTLSRLGIETSNLYTGFVAVALDQLRRGGQLVAITPRSFCNGRYFDPFRKLLLQQAAIGQIHVYHSRKRAFADDNVLQENIIYELTKGEPQPKTVRVTSSSGPLDRALTTRDVPFAEVVRPSDPHMYIHLAVSDADGLLAGRISSLPCTLGDLNITVSTGRVVDFRAKEHLRKTPEPQTVPLIYPTHFDEGYVTWPKENCRKHNALALNENTTDLVVPRGTYVLAKRFTSKEEKRRVVAAVYDPKQVPAEWVGFENHLNYFHQDGKGLPAAVAKGLAIFLNSTAVDQYFRQFSGHTQVNATDLRNLRYPTLAQLKALGSQSGDVMPSKDAADDAVEAILN